MTQWTGPVADALLSYSQSTDPASPHYADQTRTFSAKRWHRLPFSLGGLHRSLIRLPRAPAPPPNPFL